MLNCLVHVLFTFCIQDVLKLKKYSGAKGLMYELKKNGKVFTSKFVATGPSSYEKRIYRAAVSQKLRNTGLDDYLFRKIYTNYYQQWYLLRIQSRTIIHFQSCNYKQQLYRCSHFN